MYSRRDFFNKVFRTLGFTVLAAGSAYLIMHEQSDEKCDLNFVCKNCKKVKECKLPEAKHYN